MSDKQPIPAPAPQQEVPAEWKLVPLEITSEMADAWQTAFNRQLQKRVNSRGRLKSAAHFKKSCEEVAYVAMLAAAPKAPQPTIDDAVKLYTAQPAPSRDTQDTAMLDWLDRNIFYREMDEWDVKYDGRGDQNMWVLFAPKGVQGTARNIIDAARKEKNN